MRLDLKIMKTAIVLGADRVGKTTLIEKSSQLLTDIGKNPYRLHFSGVLPHHNSPIDQFLEPFSIASFHDVDYLFCDRFSPEALFYEAYRRKSGTHPAEYSHVVESLYMEKSEDLRVVLLCPYWNDTIKSRHEIELRIDYPRGTEWWINKMLTNRKEEHIAYYDFMTDYLENHSLFKSDQIVYWSAPVDNIFDILPEYTPNV